jgi:hypothetical protein
MYGSRRSLRGKLVRQRLRGSPGARLPRRRLVGAVLATFVVAGAALYAAMPEKGPGDTGGGLAAQVDRRVPHPMAGEFDRDSSRLSDCGARDFGCYEQGFGNVAYDRGPQTALRLFEQGIASNRSIQADCHRIAHYIGSGALARYRGDVGKAFAEGSPTCWSGYYHGILERALYSVPDARIGVVIRGLCRGIGGRRTSYLAYQCVHGLGHGLMIQSGYDLPKSLSRCDQLSSPWDRTSCGGGVFMENIASATRQPGRAVGKSDWLRADDPVYPCNARVVGQRHRRYCYLMVTSRVLEANGFDWRRTAQACGKVDRVWIETCFQSFGRDASGYTRQNAGRIRALCRIAGQWQGQCIWGAARDITANDAGPRRASRLCNQTTHSIRGSCFEAIGTILDGLSSNESKLMASCERITRHYSKRCVSGAGRVAQ